MQLSSFELIKKGVSTIIDVVDAFARTELVRLENLINNLATVARTGSYNDLLNKPTLFSGNYNDLTNKPNLSTVATSGSYNDLLNKPTLFSGNYNDLTNKPTIPSKTSQLTNDSNFATTSQINAKLTQYKPSGTSNVASVEMGYRVSAGLFVISLRFSDDSQAQLSFNDNNISYDYYNGSAWAHKWTK